MSGIAYERGTPFLLARLGSLAARSWTAFLADRGITQNQYAVMVVLREQGPLGQRRLAELAAMDARNLVAVLDSLTAAGLAERRPHATDRRRRVATLTPSGTRLIDTAAQAAAEGQDEFLRSLSPAERDRLNDLLQRLYNAHVHA
ncbi:MarR family winged helix-turn-helix transcriptional regulator [Actinomadura bangladeshensis]|uniref:MarR family transcriptional regulator n=1 Tax=Actinomadura bangladeshensis TaxID=453573 RepID=A0A4R4PCS1_9ACTN|nr:MarR family transcriptional regulator [Actinomadura bangladeshensis]TDC19794.1 MarR family transcriptional regulator [Actinomadura bangladeshensis]